MLNNASLNGRITRDLEIRNTQSGKSVLNFSIAVERDFKNENGEKEADFIDIVVWGKSAEFLVNYSGKGDMIGVTGRLQKRSYENNGTKVYVSEVVASNVYIVNSKQSQTDNNGSYQTGNQRQSETTFEKPISMKVNNNQQSDFDFEITDDDLPF